MCQPKYCIADGFSFNITHGAFCGERVKIVKFNNEQTSLRQRKWECFSKFKVLKCYKYFNKNLSILLQLTSSTPREAKIIFKFLRDSDKSKLL